MSFLGIVTLKGQAKIAASVGGTPLNLTTIRVGDGNGAPITPNEAMTDLVRRVGKAYSITSAGPDPVDPNIWRVTTTIPETEGPFDVREIAVFDAVGDMIAIASHPVVEKRTAAQGSAVALTTDIIFAVSETANVVVTISQDNAASIADMLRAPFIVVDGVLNNPPASPAVGGTYLIGANPTGVWAGLAHKLAQWPTGVWVTAEVPNGHLIVDASKAVDDENRWLRRTATGWTTGRATTDVLGVVELATAEEAAAGTDDKRAVTPSALRQALSNFASLNPVYPEIISGFFAFTSSAGQVVVNPGQNFVHRGVNIYSTSLLTAPQRTFVTQPSKTYHLVWYPPGGGRATPAGTYPYGRFYLEDLADSAYNPSGVPETHTTFDSGYDKMLCARVVTNGANALTVQPLLNLNRLAYESEIEGFGQIVTTGSGNDGVRFTATFQLNWARSPRVTLTGHAAQVSSPLLHGFANRVLVTAQTRYAVSGFVDSDFQIAMNDPAVYEPNGRLRCVAFN